MILDDPTALDNPMVLDDPTALDNPMIANNAVIVNNHCPAGVSLAGGVSLRRMCRFHCLGVGSRRQPVGGGGNCCDIRQFGQDG